jgi:hypothetical protein
MVRLRFFRVSFIVTIDKNRVKIVEEGGIKSIVRAMKRNKDHPGIQESSCAALSSLAFKNGTLHLHLFEKSSMLNLSSFEVHLHHIVLTSNLEANKNLITEAGGIEYILAAMNNLKHVVDVQTKACAALRNLASTNSKTLLSQ